MTNLNNLVKMQKNIAMLIDVRGMQDVGLKAQELNLDQIDKEIGSDGKKFKRYSDIYGKLKGESKVTFVSKKLKSIKSLSDDDQEMIFKSVNKRGGFKKKGGGRRRSTGGHMMFAFHVHSSKGKSVVKFDGKSNVNKATWNVEHRPFIGLTKKNKKVLLKWINKRLFGK